MLKNNGFHNRHSPIYRLIAALSLDFTSGRLDPRITFSRTTNATLTNSAGLIANAPMNLLTFSEQFDSAGWVGSATVTSNALAAPNGTFTADYLVRASASSDGKYQTATSASGVCSASVYVKKDTSPNSLIWLYDATAATERLNINLTWSGSTPIVVASVGSVAAPEDVGDGWWRITGTTTSLIQGNANRFYMLPAYTAAANGQRTAFWGAQLELGSTATTYNPTTVKNLLGFTEHFDNAAWTKSNATISATKVDDIYGQPFAQKLVENTANDNHGVISSSVTVSLASHTFSVFAKKGERSWLAIALRNGPEGLGGSYTFFDLENGAIGNVRSGYTASISDVGNGFYRCSITGTTTATSVTIFTLAATGNGTTVYTGDGTSGIYIFGAQLSDSASVDPYVYNPVAAPTAQAYYGPRFDYDPVTLAPKGLLIEEQRTNLLVPSIPPVAGYGFTSNIAFTANSDVSPDGTTNATQFTITGASPSAGLGVTASSATTYTISAYVKAGSISVFTLAIGNNSTLEGFRGTFNLSAVTSSGENRGGGTYTSSTITAVGNGWYRCTVTGVTGTSPTRVYYSTTASTGNFFIWGAQLEAGAFATSYIPTVASQVTRAADNASMIGNNFARWYNQTTGTVFAQYSANGLNPGASNAAYGISDNTTANFIAGRTLSSVATNFQVRTGGADQVALNSTSVAAGAVAKSAGAYALNDFAFSTNAGTVQTDTAGTLPVVTQMQIGGLTSSVNPLNGTISRIAYYPRRLANTELQGITS